MKADNISFKIETESVEYGDNRNFFEYTILFYKGVRPVGIERGPRRETPERKDSMKLARARVVILKSHRLFAVPVTRKCISDGEARNCNTCAIAQALWHNQERMGLPQREYQFDVSPYGAWVDPRGLVLSKRWEDEGSALRIPATELPDIAIVSRSGKVYKESMLEWAMYWDDWAESRYMGLKEWREKHGYGSDEWPSRPGPCSFVLDLDAMKAEAA